MFQLVAPGLLVTEPPVGIDAFGLDHPQCRRTIAAVSGMRQVSSKPCSAKRPYKSDSLRQILVYADIFCASTQCLFAQSLLSGDDGDVRVLEGLA